MSERKVLNKYYPPDFDPSLIPRLRRGHNPQYVVRLMMPFSSRCNSCGEWIPKGRKFNARKEDAEGEKYLSIQIYRFYVRCPRCSAEVTFKTDPKNADYICEHGAQRNFEPWREEKRAEEENRKEKEEEEEFNHMAALENRTEESKREIDILDALDDVRSLKAQHEGLNIDSVIELHQTEKTRAEEQEIADEERQVREAFGSKGDNYRVAVDENGEVIDEVIEEITDANSKDGNGSGNGDGIGDDFNSGSSSSNNISTVDAEGAKSAPAPAAAAPAAARPAKRPKPNYESALGVTMLATAKKPKTTAAAAAAVAADAKVPQAQAGMVSLVGYDSD